MTVDIERTVYAAYGRSLIIRPSEEEDTDALFEQVCAEFDNSRIEQDAEGNVYIMPPTGIESSDQNSEITAQLRIWSKQNGHGRSFDSSVLFKLPDGSKLGPDASWVSNEKLASLSKEDRRKFAPLVPEFVIELKSSTDRLSQLQLKMQDWMRNGVELGWLIDPGKRTVLIYRKGAAEPEVVAGASFLSGDGPIAGFRLELEAIWRGLADL